MPRIADQQKDFPQWYLDVIQQAELADYSDVKGCIIFKPYGYALWEAVQRDLDRRIKALGVQNCYFPLFIPESAIAKEKEHVEGFAPECAVVTHGGGKELTEKLYVRPTSETVIYPVFARWIQSHRDLPLKVNQWANVVRWEMRTRPFLRTLEFLWQEGHTAHATKADADAMVSAALQMYVDFDKAVLALPVLRGRKPDHEKFAGALYTLTTEALARDGKAIQAGTSHNLGQGFAEAYGVQFLDEGGTRQHTWITSWGLSTRIIGTVIVVHGDEKGLRLPPNFAPVQVVIVPIYKSDEERDAVLAAAKTLTDTWGLAGMRVHVDDRDGKSPGYKFNEWEVKGVPLRVEIGPKDLQKGQVMIARRDTSEKLAIAMAEATPERLMLLLQGIQQTLYTQAKDFLESRTKSASTMAELEKAIDDGCMVWALWDGTRETAAAIQDKTKASIRLLPENDETVSGTDVFSGKPAKYRALFAKSY
jgi:prolyl-tRNA synthetase